MFMFEWERAHHELVGLAVDRAKHEHALGRALLRAEAIEAWRAMGFGSFVAYVESIVGLTPRQIEERLRVARALEDLGAMGRALESGRVQFSIIRELSRVATPETERAWLEAAKGKTAAEVARMVSGRKVGDRPGAEPEVERHRVVLEVSAEIYATYREAQAKLRKDGWTEEEGLLLMARALLGGQAETGRSSYQVMMNVCADCGRGSQDARGDAVPVDAAVTDAALCDAQVMDARGRVAQAVPPATRRLVMRRHHGKCAVPSCRFTAFVDVHHLDLRSENGNHDPDRLIALCTAHHVATHRGTLRIEGRAPTGFTFTHADGSVFGQLQDPRMALVLCQAFEALKELGFKERDAWAMIDRARPHVGARDGVDEAVRAALA